jgi:hypothetical protein
MEASDGWSERASGFIDAPQIGPAKHRFQSNDGADDNSRQQSFILLQVVT